MTKEEKKLELEVLKKQRNNDIENGLTVYEANDSTIRMNKLAHWPLFAGLKIQRFITGYKLHKLNEVPKYYFDENKNKLKTFERPVIFAPNHVRKKDIEMILEAMKKNVILLSGDFENVHGTLSGSLLEKNGIIYFDMEDHLDRKNVIEVEKQVLGKNNHIMKFYEAAWNLSPNLLVYNGYYSLVQTAIDTNALVIPVTFEQKVELDMSDKNVYIKFGEPIDYSEIFCEKDKVTGKRIKRNLSKDEKIKGLEILKQEIAKNLLEIIDKYSFIKRSDLEEKYKIKYTPKDYFTPDYKMKSSVEPYWDEYKKRVLSEWSFDEEDISKKHFVDKNITPKEEAFAHLDELNLNSNNAFLLSKRNHH